MATSGAHPLSTFPNDHFKPVNGYPNFSPPVPKSAVAELREQVNSTDWATLSQSGKTKYRVEANWSASEERCARLQALCKSVHATKVLEIGAFCGVATLSIAEVLPADGQITSLELDPYLVEFGSPFVAKSGMASRIKTIVGDATESLKDLAQQAGKSEPWNGPFDLVMIDADKEGMLEYFSLVWKTDGMLTSSAKVCVDTTTFKGQLFTPYVKSGRADQWVVNSGHDKVQFFHNSIRSGGEFDITQEGNLLVTTKRSTVSRARSRSPVRGVTSGANPLATFPNDRVQSSAKWVPPVKDSPVAALRNRVYGTDWGQLFKDGKTKMRVDSTWSANEERCKTLTALCKEVGARRVLEIGGCCGVATLAVAEVLPEDGQITSLELDGFLVEYTQDIIAKSDAGQKVRQLVGPAMDTLKDLAKEAGATGPFELVVIDADKQSVADYFHYLWETPGLLVSSATVCVDMTPFKGQLLVQQYVKHGKPDEWVVYSGQEQLDSLRSSIKASSDFTISERNGLLIARKRT